MLKTPSEKCRILQYFPQKSVLLSKKVPHFFVVFINNIRYTMYKTWAIYKNMYKAI